MNLSGVGEKTERKLKKIGILKAEDFLQYYPNHYEYFPYLTYIKDLAHLEEGTVVSIWVQLKVNVMRSGKVTRIWGEDSSGDINISWFHPPYTVRQLKRGSKAVLRGPISFFRDKPCMVSAKYCYITHELRLHQNDRCKRFALCLVLTVRFRSLAPWGKLFQLFI